MPYSTFSWCLDAMESKIRMQTLSSVRKQVDATFQDPHMQEIA